MVPRQVKDLGTAADKPSEDRFLCGLNWFVRGSPVGFGMGYAYSNQHWHRPFAADPED
jgi:hypothetical protein